MSEMLDTTNAAPKRPTFLTVLCILSFIGAGVSIVLLLLATVLAGAATAGTTMVDTSNMSAEGQAAMDAAQGAIGNVWLYLGLAIAMVVVSLVGVIKMWKLQKSGYYMYVGAAVAGIIVDIAVGAGFTVGGLIFPVAFIVMYGLNLKHMK